MYPALKCYVCSYATGDPDGCNDKLDDKYLQDCKYPNPVCWLSNANSGAQ